MRDAGSRAAGTAARYDAPVTNRRSLPLRLGPLAGATVIVTRASGTATALRRQIAALGGRVIGLPGVALRAVADAALARRALAAATRADRVVFVSPAAVRFAWALRPGLRFARRTVVAAPGPGSARALRRRGVAAPLFPRVRNDSEGILALPAFAAVRGLRVALVGAAGGRDLLARELRARGAVVAAVEVYRREPPRLLPRHLAALEAAAPPLITLVSSAEALANLHAGLPGPLFARLAANECVASSARIAESARRLGLCHVHVGASADPQALLAEACTVLALHRL